MLKRTYLAALCGVLWLSLGIASAQTATTTPTAEETNTVNWFWAACDNKAVVDLSGNMLSGFSLYLQVFRETQGSGTPLSDVVRVAVNGNYSTSQIINYPSGQTLATGQFASLRISIAPTGNPSAPSYTTVVDDTFDTCITPANTASTVGGTAAVGSTSATEGGVPAAGTLIGSSGVLKPSGGVLNPVFAQAAEGVVTLGARPSLNARVQGRVTDVGLIFAECNQVRGAAPGVLWDTDPITIFWSWYAKTPDQVRDHQAKVRYEAFFSAPGAPFQPLPINPSPIVRREDGNYWVFYVVELGGNWQPGGYAVNLRTTWAEPTFDGYADFGPGTETPELNASCSWDITPNPYGVKVNYRSLRLFP